jgi:hypothetical protein
MRRSLDYNVEVAKPDQTRTWLPHSVAAQAGSFQVQVVRSQPRPGFVRAHGGRKPPGQPDFKVKAVTTVSLASQPQAVGVTR